MKKRIRNPYFWIGILGTIGMALGITLENFTTWATLGSAIWESFKNPALVIPMLMTLVGVYVDPSTGGFKDAEPTIVFTKEEEHE
jgi:phi LC3 family holin